MENKSSTPTEAENSHALRVVEAFEEHQNAGMGAFALDGKMIEAPNV